MTPPPGPCPDETCDLVVAGSGAGGLSAAIVAASAGLRVVVLEKTAHFGGSTAISGGVLWVPANSQMADLGLSDSAEQARRYLQATVGDHRRREMIDAYLRHAPAMVDYFNAHTQVKLVTRAEGPDYAPDADGAAQAGRMLDPAIYDGRKLGRWFARLRPPLPQLTILGGMMVNRKDIAQLTAAFRSPRALLHSLRLILPHLRDRLFHPRGTRLLTGNALAARLLRSAIDAGVDLRSDTRVEEILRSDGRVSGVMFQQGGVRQRITARRGVIIATGGFPGNAELASGHIPLPNLHRSMAPAGNVGEGIGMMLAAGAVLDQNNANNAFFTPVSVLRRKGAEIRFPHLILDRQKPGLIAVNRRGQRFVNEACSYHDFVLAMHRDGNAPAFLVCDSRFQRRYGLGLAPPSPGRIAPFRRAGYLRRGRTVAELAKAIGVPADALEQSVARANVHALSGHDPEFGKGRSAYDRYLGDPAHRPNPCLGPIDKPPFYAVEIFPGDIGTARGVRTSPRAEVLDGEDNPIPGLYACGNDMNSIMGGTYPSGGITLGPAMTFGYIAGLTVAGLDGPQSVASPPAPSTRTVKSPQSVN